jgi:hypothetical protein
VDEAAMTAVGSINSLYVLRYDQSGNARHEAQLSTNGIPGLKAAELNGRVAIDWGTASGYVSVGNTIASGQAAAYEIFRLIKRPNDPPTAGQGFFWQFDANTNHVPYTSGVIFDGFAANPRHTAGDPTLSFTSWRLYSVYSAASDWANYIDGTQFFQEGTNTVTLTNAEHYLFSDAGGLFTGEDILFEQKLSSTDRQKVFDSVEAAYSFTF